MTDLTIRMRPIDLARLLASLQNLDSNIDSVSTLYLTLLAQYKQIFEVHLEPLIPLVRHAHISQVPLTADEIAAALHSAKNHAENQPLSPDSVAITMMHSAASENAAGRKSIGSFGSVDIDLTETSPPPREKEGAFHLPTATTDPEHVCAM